MSFPRMLDTCVLSAYIGSRAREKTPRLVNRVDEVMATDGARLSIVTVYEIERGLRRLELEGQGSKKRRVFTMLLGGTTVYGLDEPAARGWEIAADLHARAAVRSPALVIAEADLLIIATAVAHGLTLVTSDVAMADHARTLRLGAQVELIAVE